MVENPMRARRFLFFACAGLLPTLPVACGSKTGLLVAEPSPDAEAPDASVDVIVRHPEAAPVEEDAAEEDALPPIDVTLPPPFNDCPDAASTLIYVITQTNQLLSFYPPTATFSTVIGNISCPSSSTPFSMAVDRNGIAYIVFGDGELFEVDTQGPALPCRPTGFVMQPGFSFAGFGMGFSHNNGDAGETLYVASGMATGAPGPPQLATIDTTSFALRVVGNFNPTIDNTELTGTGAGDLFGFHATDGGSGIAQVDKSNAQVFAESPLPGVFQGQGWAFAFWGGDFYTFTAPVSPSTVVTRFRPSDHSIVQVAQTGDLIVGAGVSTCAPQR
jgi:hypothetical protein